jgi:hypothetical protein
MNRDEVKAEADRLLRASGFRDIEAPSGLISDKPFDGSRAAYYRAAEEMLERYPWAQPHHREIWWRHCQGDASRAIARDLALNRKTVDAIVLRVRSAMQARLSSRSGRPQRPCGHGLHSKGVYVRLAEHELMAADELARRWRCNIVEALRRAATTLAREWAK